MLLIKICKNIYNQQLNSIIMFKFIALHNAVYYSLDDTGGQIRFYANRQGTGYDTRKDITPKVMPSDALIKEIRNRPAICSDMTDDLKALVNTLEKNFNALDA